jgi:hypothetical protein
MKKEKHPFWSLTTLFLGIMFVFLSPLLVGWYLWLFVKISLSSVG